MTDTSDKSGVPPDCHSAQLSLRSDSDECATSSLCCKSDNANDTEVKRIAGDGAAFSCDNLSGEIRQNVDNKRTTAGSDTTDAVPSTPHSPLPPERSRVVSEAVSESDPSFTRRDVHRSSTEPDELNKKNADTEVADTNLVASTSTLALRESGDDERCDVFMIFCEDDETNARKFVDILEKFLRPSKGRNPRFFRERNLGEDFFDYQEKGLELSRFKFIFLDKNSSDVFNEFLIHRALHRMIKQRDRQSVVPVKARHAVNVPDLLEMFCPLDIQRLLRGRLLDDITYIDINNLTRSDLDENVLSNIKKKLDQETT